MKHFLAPAVIGFMFFFLHCAPARAQDARHYTCYRTEDPVAIDGIAAEPDWALAEWSDDFADITGNPSLRPAFRTRVKMLWDDQFIYLFAWLEEPDVWATLHNRDTVIFQDNDFEVFLDPEGKGHNYFEIELNAFGTVWDLMLTKPYSKGGIPLNGWDLAGLKHAVRIHGTLNDASVADSCWTVEMALPVGELMKDKEPAKWPSDGVRWRLNFSRVEWETVTNSPAYRKKTDPLTGKSLPEKNWVWAPMGEVSMHIPERWGWLEFSQENIRVASLKFPSEDQKNSFSILAWSGGHDSWPAGKWDSLFSAMHSNGVTRLLINADAGTLKKIIPQAHNHQLAIEKWFITLMNNDPALIRDHPDWYVVNREGKSSVTDPAYVDYYRFLCASNPGVRQYLRSRMEEYLEIQGLDGIHLDYIRYPDVILPEALWTKYGIVQDKEYPPYDYCYCPVCRDQFRKTGGTDPLFMEHPEEDSAWRQFRCGQVTALVTELAEQCHASGKKISAAVFPGPSVARRIVRQDWDRWPLDEAMPMLYHSFYNSGLGWIGEQTTEGVTTLHGTTSLYSGLYIPSLTPRELQTAIRKSIESGAAGISLFTYEAMSPEHWHSLKEIISY